jgi:hypothetical protein
MRLLKLLKLFKIGFPDINDPVAVKAWLTKVVEFLESIAKETATAVDDMALTVLKPLLLTDASFDVLYKLLKMIAGKLSPDIDHVVGSTGELESDADIQTACEAAIAEAGAGSTPQMIPWAMLLQIAVAIVSLLLKK